MRMRWTTIAAAAMTLAAQAAYPATAGKPVPAGECVQATRGTVYSNIANDRYRCEVVGNRLMVIDLGRKEAAPEGTYREIPGGRSCLVGKDGIILSCRLE